jgi:hypothetical protein
MLGAVRRRVPPRCRNTAFDSGRRLLSPRLCGLLNSRTLDQSSRGRRWGSVKSEVHRFIDRLLPAPLSARPEFPDRRQVRRDHIRRLSRHIPNELPAKSHFQQLPAGRSGSGRVTKIPVSGALLVRSRNRLFTSRIFQNNKKYDSQNQRVPVKFAHDEWEAQSTKKG